MSRFEISNTKSGIHLGIYSAPDAQAALEAMARDAGYASYELACAAAPVAPGEIVVCELHA